MTWISPIVQNERVGSKNQKTRKLTKKVLAPKSNTHNIAKITVVGVGGGGGNAVSRMRDDMVRGIDFVAVNTDVQDLEYCNARTKIHIGKTLTRGLGTGMNPELGRQAAEENKVEIAEALRGSDLVFITAGLGGGTGSGATAIVAEAAKEVGALTIAVLTKPFTFEGGQRSRIAQEALEKIKQKVDAFIVVPNDKIFNIIGKDTSINKAFEAIDGVLRNAVQGISELVAMPGIINVDFADVKAIVQDAGSTIVGIGYGNGQGRASNAVNSAINSPLLDVSIEGAKGVLFGVSGGRDLKMNEVNEIAKAIADGIDPAAKIIFGAYHDRKLKAGQLKVTLIATGFNGAGTIQRSPDLTMSSLFESNQLLNEKPLPTMKPVEPKKSFNEDKKSSNPKPPEEKKSSDIWDIPAFLRKKKK